MRPTRTTLIALIILFIISAASVGYLFYTPASAKAESELLETKLAALRGDPESQMDYGLQCMISDSKFDDGMSWIKKACDQGYPPALCFMGECYFEGRILEKDVAKGIELYRQSAIKGYYSAQSRLADCYVNGTGVNKNTTEALKWYHLAALSGDSLAMNNIGSIYLHADGVEENLPEAFKWFFKAAMCGNSGSQLTVGQLLSIGDGCEKNEVEAYAWLKIAAEEEADATKELIELRKKITADQIAEAMVRMKFLQAKILEIRQSSTNPTVSKN